MERIQLDSTNGRLELRYDYGAETPCESSDLAAAISSVPALCEIRDEQVARIACVPDIVGQLPFLLEPVVADDNAENLSVKVNRAPWSAFRTDDERWAMLPGWSSEDGPEMDPCSAEFRVGEGEDNLLTGWASIGIAVPGAAVEYALYCGQGCGPRGLVEYRDG